jgi:hypothetical protein
MDFVLTVYIWTFCTDLLKYLVATIPPPHIFVISLIIHHQYITTSEMQSFIVKVTEKQSTVLIK